MDSLFSTEAGEGPLVVFVHGGMNTGELAWFAQLPLAEHWTVRCYDRVGYGRSAPLSAGEDIERDVALIAAQLDSPVHLVGHSSGALVATLVAAHSPATVRSLTLIEPPAFRHLDDPRVRVRADIVDALLADRDASDRAWLTRFIEEVLGAEALPPDSILEILEQHVPTLRHAVPGAQDIEVPIDELVASGVPVMVVSGGNDESFELICDCIAAQLGARREVIPGAGHGVQWTGQPFNDALASFLRSVEGAT
jgi:pimeloyl-ACP methyl ester carboxylesterase